MLDMIMNIREMMSVMEMMQTSQENAEGNSSTFDPMELLTGMLAPEQQEMFRMYSDMFLQTSDSAEKGDETDGQRMDDNPAMKNIDPAKLDLIRMAAEKTSGKSGRDLAPVMLALITSANKQGISFSPDEVALILEILKKGKTKEEQEQIDRTVRMTSSIFKKHQK